MGLLDFLSSKPATSTGQSGLVVSPSPAQASVTQTDPIIVQPQKNYKDLQYPMPAADSTQLGTSVLPQANGLQPKLNYATETLPPVSNAAQPEAVSPHVETILDNGVRQVNHTADVAPSSQPTLESTSQALYSYSNNPVPADVLVEQAVLTNSEETEVPLPPQTPAVETTSQPLNNTLEASNIGNPVQTSVPGVTVASPVPQMPNSPTSEDESQNGDIIEIGSAASNPVSDESQEEVAPDIQPVAPVEVAEPVEDITEVPTPVEQAAVTPTEPTQDNKNMQPVVPKKVETPVAETDETKVENESNSLNVLNKIAFISLNTQSVNSSLSQKVKSLAAMLKDMNTEVFIDSNKGYGMDIISGLSGTTGKVTAAYLKPFFSKYSDETTLDVPITNLTKVTFSSVLDRIKFLYKEATVFIVPETSGLNSLSQVMILLNSQAMYFGSHKPVILFGTAWKDRINTLKSSFALSQQEIDSMYFASTQDEVITLLKKLDSEFSDKKVTKGSVIDMRDELDEKEGLLAA